MYYSYQKVNLGELERSPPPDVLWGTTWLSNGRSHICITTGYHWWSDHPMWPVELVRVTDIRYVHMERWDRMFYDCQDLTFVDDNVDRLLQWLKYMVHDGFELYHGSDPQWFPKWVQPDFQPRSWHPPCKEPCAMCRVARWLAESHEEFELKIET